MESRIGTFFLSLSRHLCLEQQGSTAIALSSLSLRRNEIGSAVIADERLITTVELKQSQFTTRKQQFLVETPLEITRPEIKIPDPILRPQPTAVRSDTIYTTNSPVTTHFNFLEMSVTMPSYIICRDTQPGQPIDPTAPLVFFPPKDSDELFDALRMKYPTLRTHSERMGQAVIEFLMEEQQLPQMPVDQLPTPTTANSMMTSPWETSMQSMSSDASTWSSPELFDLATPTFGNSPQPQAQTLSRQQSTATSTTAASNPTPPALEQMTGVFSLSDAAQPKQRVRRKMTEAEKVEYRKRRIVKACEKCSKRKRKCNHNQPDMENVGASKAQKVTKPSPTAANKKPPLGTPRIQEENINFGASVMDFSNSFDSNMSFPELNDFSTIFEDPLPEMSFDDLLMPMEQPWAWSDTADFTLMDSGNEGLDDTNRAPQPNATPPRSGSGAWFDQSVGHDLEWFNHDSMQTTGGGQDKKMLWEHLRTGQEVIATEKQQPTHTPHVHEMEKPQQMNAPHLYEIDAKDAFAYEADYAAAALGWNRPGIQSNQSWPQHNIPTGALNFDADHTMPSRWSSHGLLPEQSAAGASNSGGNDVPLNSLSQMTLRLTGTANAVKAFGNLLPNSSSQKKRLQAVSPRKVALLALGGLSMAQGLQQQQQFAGRLLTSCNDSSCVSAGTRCRSQKDLSRHLRSVHPQGDPRGDPQQTDGRIQWSTLGDTSTLEGMTIQDYLRMHTNAIPVQEDGRATRSIASTALKEPRSQDVTSIASASALQAPIDVERNVKSKTQISNPDSVSRSATMPRPRVPAAQQGRQTPSLGEGITTSASPWTESYLLKRRIPKTVHSIVDRDSPATGLGPLLMTIPEDVDTYHPGDHEREIIISRNTECTEGNSYLAEGGAYLTSEAASNKKKPVNTGGLGAASSSAQPVHTRPRRPSSSGFAGGTNSFDTARVTSTSANVLEVERLNDNQRHRDHFGRTSFASPTVNSEEVERLSDHFRNRDHFGRVSRSNLVAGLMFSLAAFATLVLLSFMQTTPATLSLLLLALAAPMQEGAGSKGKILSISQAWLRPLRDIVENSSWHTGLFSPIPRHLRYRIEWQRDGSVVV